MKNEELNRLIYSRIEALCRENGVSINKMMIETKMDRSKAVRWKQGMKPNESSLKKIGDYFGVPVSYFTMSVPNEMERYFLLLSMRPELKELLEACAKIPREKIESITDFLDKMVGGLQ